MKRIQIGKDELWPWFEVTHEERSFRDSEPSNMLPEDELEVYLEACEVVFGMQDTLERMYNATH